MNKTAAGMTSNNGAFDPLLRKAAGGRGGESGGGPILRTVGNIAQKRYCPQVLRMLYCHRVIHHCRYWGRSVFFRG